MSEQLDKNKKPQPVSLTEAFIYRLKLVFISVLGV